MLDHVACAMRWPMHTRSHAHRETLRVRPTRLRAGGLVPPRHARCSRRWTRSRIWRVAVTPVSSQAQSPGPAVPLVALQNIQITVTRSRIRQDSRNGDPSNGALGSPECGDRTARCVTRPDLFITNFQFTLQFTLRRHASSAPCDSLTGSSAQRCGAGCHLGRPRGQR